MSGAGLYLSSRCAPQAAATAAAGVAVIWGLWLLVADARDVEPPLVVLVVLLMVSAAAATLAPPDVALERTAALAWPPRRLLHLLAVIGLVVGVAAVTLGTGARFGPLGLVVRDAAGLLGLAALGAALWSAQRGWFLPVAWTLPAVVVPAPDSVAGRVLTWQIQSSGDVAAGVTAGVLAAAGALAYVRWGPARRTDAESGR
jgi:hypothetical protein